MYFSVYYRRMQLNGNMLFGLQTSHDFTAERMKDCVGLTVEPDAIAWSRPHNITKLRQHKYTKLKPERKY